MEKVVEYLKNAITDKMILKDVVNIFEKVCQPMNEDDMILFETGTYSFTGEKLFLFSLVKQIPAEDDEYYQLHIDVLYQPDAENRKLNTTVWDEDIDENIFDFFAVHTFEFVFSDYLYYMVYNEQTQTSLLFAKNSHDCRNNIFTISLNMLTSRI